MKKIVRGKVPAMLNGEEVNLILIWNDANPNGKVVGAEKVVEYGNTTLAVTIY